MRPTWAVTPGKRGRGATSHGAGCGPEDGTHRAYPPAASARRSGASLCSAVSECVEPGSVVHTDGWASYGGLSALGYRHEVTRQSSAPVGEDPLPRVHRVASLLKRWMLGTHHGAIRPSHLDYYLDEFTFRFNRRTSRSRGKLFYRLAQQMMAVDPLPQSQLRGGQSDDNTKT